MSKCVLVAALIAVWALGSSAQQDNAEILSTLQRVDSKIKFIKVEQRVAAPRGSFLILARGSEWEDGPGLFTILLRERAGMTRIMGSFREGTDDIGDCCFVIKANATPNEVVLSRRGEKSPSAPNLKFFLDVAAGTSAQAEYGPFSVQDVRDVAGIPHFIASDGKNLLVVRASARTPFLELLSERERTPVLSRLNVAAEQFRTTTGRHSYVDREARFGPDDAFIIDNGDAIKELQNGVTREFPFPKSTFEELVAANLALKNSGATKENVLTEERIGPWQVVGSRLWFGREFWSGEGAVGVGAFGYFDASTRSFKIFSPPEVRDASVFALYVEASVAWLGRGGHAEYGDGGDGLLRVDLQTMNVQKYRVPGMATAMARLGDRLYIGTSEGVSVLQPNGQIENYFIDISKNRSYHLSRSTTAR